MSDTETVTLKEHFEKIIEADRRANDQRFKAFEEAIKTADHTRDVAINKAEASIEKKSDIAYVKISDLQTSLAEVMLRPEIEGKFTGQSEKIEEVKKEIALLREAKSSGVGKEEAQNSGRQRNQWTIGIIITIIFSSLAFLFTVLNFVTRLIS